MGWQNAVSVRALQIIVSSGAAGQGIFVYSGTPAAGNLPVFAVAAPGVSADPFGNAISAITEIGKQSGGHWHWDVNGNLDINNTGAQLIATLRPTDQALLFYSPGGGAGSLLLSAASASGTDQFGDPYPQGFTAQASGGFPNAQLTNGLINFNATAGQFSPGIVESAGVAGEVAITSGLATGADSAANIIIDSASASGTGQSLVALQGATVQLTSGGATLPSGSQVAQGAAPAAYNQAYTQGTVNRVNTIIAQLSAAKITN